MQLPTTQTPDISSEHNFLEPPAGEAAAESLRRKQLRRNSEICWQHIVALALRVFGKPDDEEGGGSCSNPTILAKRCAPIFLKDCFSLTHSPLHMRLMFWEQESQFSAIALSHCTALLGALLLIKRAPVISEIPSIYDPPAPFMRPAAKICGEPVGGALCESLPSTRLDDRWPGAKKHVKSTLTPPPHLMRNKA